jgi:hypothetical protein
MPTYKINYSGGKPRVINVNKLPNKTTLQSLDRVYLGQPFVNVVSKFQDTRGLDTIYLGQPFYGHTDAIAIPSSRISTTNNPDVDNWLATIALNGGSASSSTIAALNSFCNTIDSAGIRNKFYRLNLFCGNNLASCLVPLYVNTNYTLPVTGGLSVDTNNNFVSGDYVETGATRGLKGNQNNKFLNTNLSPSMLPSFAHHISVYAPFQNATHTFRGLIGASESLNTRQASLYQWINAGQFNYVAGANNSVTIQAFVTPPPVFMLGSLGQSGSAFFALDGAVTSGTLSSYSASTQPWFVFGESRAGALANPTDARISAYSIGLPMTSGEAASLRSAFVAMHSAMGGL